MQHYEAALRSLEDADERAALEALDLAEVFLERAQDDDVRRGLVAEVSLARGALLEVADPMNARLAYDRSFSADGNAATARAGTSSAPAVQAPMSRRVDWRSAVTDASSVSVQRHE